MASMPFVAFSQAIEEVTVTATRKVESLQDIPLSVQALDAEALDFVRSSNKSRTYNKKLDELQQQVKELARSSSMSQLMQQSSNHRQGGRETMEVLDTASNPSTARSHTNEYDYELGANDDGEEQRLGAGSGRSNSSDHSRARRPQDRHAPLVRCAMYMARYAVSDVGLSSAKHSYNLSENVLLKSSSPSEQTCAKPRRCGSVVYLPTISWISDLP